MKTKMFAIYDGKCKAYRFPHENLHAGAAIRDFQDKAASKDNTIGLHPEDFTLYEVGEYDDSNGQLSAHKNLVNLGTALSLKPSQASPLKG